MVRRTLIALAAAALLMAGIAGQALAVPQHLHCLTLPNGNVISIAHGVTENAPHDTAFHNLHMHVHQGAFLVNPLGPLTTDLTAPFTCPPS